MPETSLLNIAKHLQPIVDITGLELSTVVELALAVGSVALTSLFFVAKWLIKLFKQWVANKKTEEKNTAEKRIAEEKKSAEDALLALQELRKDAANLLRKPPELQVGAEPKIFEKLEDRTKTLNITLTTRFGAPEVCFSPASLFRVGSARRNANQSRWGSHANETRRQAQQRKRETSKADADYKTAVNELKATFDNAEAAVREFVGVRDKCT